MALSQSESNRQLLLKLVVIAVGMFGFAYALIPLYEKICEVTGINSVTRAESTPVNGQVDRSRWVTVVFDANLRGSIPWRFAPGQSSLKVNPGELAQVVFEVENLSGRKVVGQAVPSYAPMVGGKYFKKLECFCFRQQTFNPGEVRKMPVVFVIDRNIPAEIDAVTLSYGFYEAAGLGG